MSKRNLILAMVIVAAFVLGGILQPFQHLSVSAQPGCQTFKETGKTVCGRFLEYWQKNGGLAQQGLPLSGEFTEINDLNGKPYVVQYFERAVFEKHPENAGTQYDVLLSQLGRFQFQRKYPNGEPGGTQQPTAVPSGETVTFTGKVGLKTAPFQMSGGTYVGEWVAKDTSTYGCFFNASLEAVNDPVFFGGSISSASPKKNETLNGSSYLYNIKAGQYYVEVLGSCEWSVTIKRP